MIRVLLPVVLVLAMACGAENTAVTEMSDDVTGDVAAPAAEAPAAPAREMAGSAEPSATEAAASGDAVSARCLALVTDGKFEEAIPACTEALGLEPANAEVQQALDKAKAGAANAAMKSAADDPAGAAKKLMR